jgi:hypothetical protein
VTSLDRNVDLQSPVQVNGGAFNGTLSRTIQFPVPATNGSLVAISFRLGSGDLNDADTAQFFALFSCSTGQTVATCTGQLGSCPESVAEYFPDAQIDTTGFTGDFGEVLSRREISNYFYIQNKGKQPLQILGYSLEGRDAEAFSLPYFSTSEIQGGDYGYLDVNLKPGSVGAKSATLKIQTNDFDNPVLTVPLSANVQNRPYLSVEVEHVKQIVVKGRDGFSGFAIVRNVGFSGAAAGIKLRVVEEPGTSEDTSAPRELLSMTLPRIAAGKAVKVKFVSGNHDFSEGGVKEITGSLRGNRHAIGGEYDRSDEEYFYADAKKSVHNK